MLAWVIQVTAVSLCFIAVIHYLYIFFKTTLTVPKVKDLVNRPQQQYDELFKGINGNNLPGLLPIGSTSSGSGSNSNSSNINTNPMTTIISSLSPMLYDQQQQQQHQQPSQMRMPNTNIASAAMKDELKQFVKKLNGTNRA